MLLQLDNIQGTVNVKKYEIEAGVDEMEEGKKARDVKKKEILLYELKKVLVKLNEVDKSIVKDLKGEAFDYLRGLRKINDEIVSFKSSLMNAPESDRNWKTEVNSLEAKVESLEMEDFVQCLKISVGIQPGSMMTGFERVVDAIFLETPALESKGLSLDIPELMPTYQAKDFNPNYLEIKIYNLSDSSSCKFSSMMLQKTMITMTGQVHDIGTKVLEECSVEFKMEKKAQISEDGKSLTIKLLRPRNMVAKISVHLLGSNIVNSPITHKFVHDEAAEPAMSNMTIGNDSIGIFDMTGVDQSNVNGMESINRQKVLFLPEKQHLLSNPEFQPSPAYHPLRRASQHEKVVPAEKLNDTTPFSPNPTYASTMRATVAASHLAGALDKVPDQDEGSSNTPENSQMDESDLSILAPSKNSAISIDEMQRSLSGSEDGVGDKSAFQLDKSVSFAPRTQVVEVLSTPQVTASSGGPRFVVAQGKTKPGDGRTGHVRRLNQDEKNGGTNGIWDVTEVDEEYYEELEVESSFSHPVALPRPLIAEMLDEHHQSCISPSGDSLDEDPHLMLNASKAPTPQRAWSKEDSIWDVIDMKDSEDNYDEYEACSDAAATLPLLPRDKISHESESSEGFYEDPHLMLNASKAPSPQSAWSKEDSLWDWGLEQSPNQTTPRQDFNQTIWETETNSVNKFDFREPLEVVDVYESQPSVISRRGTTFCLISPHSIAHLPHQNLFLVTEPDQNRIGCYKEDLKFYCWLNYPKQFARTRQNYEYPTSMLTLTNECLVLLEKTRLHIFDSHGASLQCFSGEYNGLSEGPNGEIYTLGKNSSGQAVIKKFEKSEASYKVTGQVVITAIQEFDNWEVLSQARFLLYSKEKIFITDEGLHKLYVVDIVTGKQTVSGYLGCKSGQFKRPTGLLADEEGNVLVGDSDNNRLLVYTEEGKFLKVVQQQADWRYSAPHGMVRQGMYVLAVFRGEEMGGKGTVVKYKVAGDSGPNTPDTGSEI